MCAIRVQTKCLAKPLVHSVVDEKRQGHCPEGGNDKGLMNDETDSASRFSLMLRSESNQR